MKVYGLIGFPLGHSFSQKYFTEKFVKENISDARFELFPLTEISAFAPLIDQQKDLKGLAVTIPYKEAVIPFLQELKEVAEQIGAVNCIQFQSGKLIGYNTDIIGFEQSFTPHLKSHHKKALVLGTGGASKAVQYVLKKIGMDYLMVSRSPDENSAIRYSDIDESMVDAYKVIINCTPLGMTPREETFPEIPYDLLGQEHYLYDLVYKPAETTFLLKGKQQGAFTKNGYEMLILQAEQNWRIWNDV